MAFDRIATENAYPAAINAYPNLRMGSAIEKRLVESSEHASNESPGKKNLLD